MRVRVAHSPDADDHFLFWAIKTARIPCPDFDFEFVAMDTEDLNLQAQSGEFDIIAISLATLPLVTKDYLLLSSGASVGRRYGPKLICKNGETESLAKAIASSSFEGLVGIPGNHTTAARLLRKLIPNVQTLEIPLSPFQGVFRAIQENQVQAAVVIHEGQLSYQEYGCDLLVDLGGWWFERTQLPIPVGVNVIHRRLGSALPRLSDLCQQSVRFALDHRDEVLPELLKIDEEQGGKLKNVDAIKHYLSLYANEDSYSLPVDAQRGIIELLSESAEEPFDLEMI